MRGSRLRQAGAGAPLTGRAIVDPYAAGTARLALAPIDFTASAGGTTHVTTRVALSGPIGGGRIDALTCRSMRAGTAARG